MRWQRKSRGYDMGNINDIIANTSNIGNILSNVQFLPATSIAYPVNGGTFLELSGAMGLQFFPVISRDIWRYKCANHRVTIKKGQDQADELLFLFPFFFEGMNMIEHHKIHVRADVCWCHVWTVQADGLWLCFLKILTSCFMFEFRTYILYHIVSYSGVLLYWMMMIMVVMMMMVVVVMMMNPLGKYIYIYIYMCVCVDIVFLEDPDGASPTQKWHLLKLPSGLLTQLWNITHFNSYILYIHIWHTTY